MRERQQVKSGTAAAHPKKFSHHLIQAPIWQELFDSQFTDRKHQPGLKQFKLLVEPCGAVRDFFP
jgi:hypothetical protein